MLGIIFLPLLVRLTATTKRALPMMIKVVYRGRQSSSSHFWLVMAKRIHSHSINTFPSTHVRIHTDLCSIKAHAMKWTINTLVVQLLFKNAILPKIHHHATLQPIRAIQTCGIHSLQLEKIHMISERTAHTNRALDLTRTWKNISIARMSCQLSVHKWIK